MWCGADHQSLLAIKEDLEEIYCFYGFNPNLQKGAMSFAGVSNGLKIELKDILSIPDG